LKYLGEKSAEAGLDENTRCRPGLLPSVSANGPQPVRNDLLSSRSRVRVALGAPDVPCATTARGVRVIPRPALALGIALASGPIARLEGQRARPAISRSMLLYDTCVAPRYRNGPAARRRLTGAEAFELEGMDSCYIDIDGFWLRAADNKGLESTPIAN